MRRFTPSGAILRAHEMNMSAHSCRLIRVPGLADYAGTLELQRSLARARVCGSLDSDVLLLVEHQRVITLGRGAGEAHVIASRDLLATRGIEVHEIERGGDVTYHGPGQLVGYPILDLTLHRQDLHWYLRQLEAALIRALGTFGIGGRRVEGYTGVWVEDRKIASIGVHVTRWVTFHGFALNVNTDLADFDLIVPCGIDAVRMTSMAAEAKKPYSLDEVAEAVADAFAAVFGLQLVPADVAELAGAISR